MRVNRTFKSYTNRIVFGLCLGALVFATASLAQTPKETPPPPGRPSEVKVPAVSESKLKNNLPVVVVQRKNVPLVTVTLLVRAGANKEPTRSAGLAEMTGSLVTKGTTTRSATDIAEQIEFLGGSINSGADWNSSEVRINVLAANLEKAIEIMADSVTNPAFAPEEIELLRQQTLDSLNVRLKQPGTLAGYAASRFSFGEHAPAGTPESVSEIDLKSLKSFYNQFYRPENAVLIFTGDITGEKANALAEKYFGKWKKGKPAADGSTRSSPGSKPATKSNIDVVKRILVIDLPDSGQAAVSYALKTPFGRDDINDYYVSNVLNSVLGGGYSARLNQEIRIKRGLSYGARSDFGYRAGDTNFIAQTQTKNESAAEVAELIVAEIFRLINESVSSDELGPRKAVLTGGFGRRLETNNALSDIISDLYLFGLSIDQLNSYTTGVGEITDKQIKKFASANLAKGDLIIVGDAKIFLDDLKKSFPGQQIEVIPVDQLDLNSPDLRKEQRAKKSLEKPSPKSRPKGKSDADRTKPDPDNQ